MKELTDKQKNNIIIGGVALLMALILVFWLINIRMIVGDSGKKGEGLSLAELQSSFNDTMNQAEDRLNRMKGVSADQVTPVSTSTVQKNLDNLENVLQDKYGSTTVTSTASTTATSTDLDAETLKIKNKIDQINSNLKEQKR